MAHSPTFVTLLAYLFVLSASVIGCSAITTKTYIRGLTSMNSEPFLNNVSLLPSNSQAEPFTHPGVYASSVIMVTWAQLQNESMSTLDTSAIEEGLAYIAKYNEQYPKTPMIGKLRVFAAIQSPPWVLMMQGGPLTLTDGSVIPRFWTTEYRNAWTNLQNLLAAVYDNDPRIGEVAVSGCVSNTAEPFVISAIPLDIPIFLANGFNDLDYQTCLSTMNEQYAAWTITPLDYTINTLNHIDSGLSYPDAVFTNQVMSEWRSKLGPNRGVIANHGLPTFTTTSPIFNALKRLGPPMEFQTVSPTVDWPAAINFAVYLGASEMEIWATRQSGGFAPISFRELQGWEPLFQ